MQSVLISGGSEDLRTREADSLCGKMEIHNLERYFFSPSDEPGVEETYGISLIRKIKQKAFLKPTHGTIQAILLLEAQNLTLPAQHALLKILEEPPDHTIIIMTAENAYSLLETIRSRCRIVSIEQNTTFSVIPEEEIIPADISIRNTLLLSEKIAKSEPKTWITNYILKLHSHLVKEKTLSENPYDILKTSKLISRLQEAYVLLTTTNTNPRLVLEHFLLNNNLLENTKITKNFPS